MTDVPESIGIATMDEQHVVKLFLRAESDDGTVGDAVITYEQSDPDYQMVIDHLGGLNVGEHKPVPPWE